MTGEDTDLTQLEVPHPMSCTLAELREIRDVFHVDLIPYFLEHGLTSIDVLEPLAFTAYRRQGKPRQAARKAAGQHASMELVPEGLPELALDESDEPAPAGPHAATRGDPPNPESSAT